MLDWKIMAASFAALLVVSSVLVGGSGIPGISGILDKVDDWMGDSPLSGFITSPVRGSKQASLILYEDPFTLPVSDISFKTGGSSHSGFSGNILINRSSEKLTFSQSDSSFRIEMPLTNLTLNNVKIGRMSLEETKFSVLSSALDTSGESADLDFSDFSGVVELSSQKITLNGNFSSITGNGKPIV